MGRNLGLSRKVQGPILLVVGTQGGIVRAGSRVGIGRRVRGGGCPPRQACWWGNQPPFPSLAGRWGISSSQRKGNQNVCRQRVREGLGAMHMGGVGTTSKVGSKGHFPQANSRGFTGMGNAWWEGPSQRLRGQCWDTPGEKAQQGSTHLPSSISGKVR